MKLNVRAVTHAMSAKLVDIYFAESENIKEEVVPWVTILQHAILNWTMNNVNIVASSLKSSNHLMTLEALLINDIKPSLNTKDEYRSRALVIKF